MTIITGYLLDLLLASPDSVGPKLYSTSLNRTHFSQSGVPMLAKDRHAAVESN